MLTVATFAPVNPRAFVGPVLIYPKVHRSPPAHARTLALGCAERRLGCAVTAPECASNERGDGLSAQKYAPTTHRT